MGKGQSRPSNVPRDHEISHIAYNGNYVTSEVTYKKENGRTITKEKVWEPKRKQMPGIKKEVRKHQREARMQEQEAGQSDDE